MCVKVCVMCVWVCDVYVVCECDVCDVCECDVKRCVCSGVDFCSLYVVLWRGFFTSASKSHSLSYFIPPLQEDLSVKDIDDIFDDLRRGKTPKPGPRCVELLNC